MKRTGFAIIELVVVIVIISALMAVAIPNFFKVKLQIALKRTANTFGQNVRKAQQLSLSAVPYKDASGNEFPVDGYGVYVDPNGLGNKKYIIYADKSPGNRAYDAQDYILETVDFSTTEPGIKINAVNNVSLNRASINFSLPKVNTTITQLSSGQSKVELVFALESETTVSGIVWVNTSGLIETR